MSIEEILALLAEFYNTNCPAGRRRDIEAFLCSIQGKFTSSDIEHMLSIDSPIGHNFLFHCICTFPANYHFSIRCLLDWYQSPATISRPQNVIRRAAAAISAVLISIGCQEFSSALVEVCMSDRGLFSNLVANAAVQLKTSASGKAILMGYQEALSSAFIEFLSSSKDTLSIYDVIACNEALQICPKRKINELLTCIFKSTTNDVSHTLEWVELLGTCLNYCTLTDLVSYFVSTLRNSPALTPVILSCIQENMDKFSCSESRVIIYHELVQALQKVDYCLFAETIQFWEDLSVDLVDSDSVTDADRKLFKDVFDIAVNFSTIQSESMECLVTATYKVLGDEFVVMCLYGFEHTHDSKYIDFLCLVGRKYVGDPKHIELVLEKVCFSSPPLFIKLCSSFSHSILRSSDCSTYCVSILKSLLHQEEYLYSIFDCFNLYSDFCDDDLLIQCAISSVNFKLVYALKMADFCSKACSKRDINFNSHLLESYFRTDSRVQVLSVFLGNPSIDFEPSNVPSLVSKVCHTIDSFRSDEEVDFLKLAVARLSSLSPEVCKSVLSRVSLNEKSYFIVLAAESENHYDCSLEFVQFGIQIGRFDEDFIRLFSRLLQNSFQTMMEFGLENAVAVLDICVTRLTEPLSKSELESILELFRIVFVIQRNDCEENWRKYLVQVTYDKVFNSLLSASQGFNQEMNSSVAAFFCSVNQEEPYLLINWSKSSPFKEYLSWMPKCVKMNEFISQYNQMFK